ncbi:MAG: hypothetical protein ACOYMG_02000 [Candidatus Methylumidiphilus sp.]
MPDWVQSPMRGRPSRLTLGLHGKEVEKGAFWWSPSVRLWLGN